jgi:hypothetical protein
MSVSQSQHLSVCLCSYVDVNIEDEGCKMGIKIIRIVEDGGKANNIVNEKRAVHNGMVDSLQLSVVQCSAMLRSTALHLMTG